MIDKPHRFALLPEIKFAGVESSINPKKVWAAFCQLG